MKKFIMTLPRWLEIAIVCVLAFGLFMAASLSYAFRPQVQAHYSAGGFVRLAVVELVLIALLAGFLALRGWTFRRIGLIPSWSDIGVGAVLLAAAYGAWIVVFYLSALVAPGVAHGMTGTAGGLVDRGIALWIIIPVALINPVFEELFETGYIVGTFKSEANIWFAVNISVAIRLVCHLYQGPLGVLSVIPAGIIFALWFARTGRLWPVIVAHAAMDLIALLSYNRGV